MAFSQLHMILLRVFIGGVLLGGLPSVADADPDERHSLEPPIVNGPWLRPAGGEAAEPVWGHADGLRVGLDPLPGPRGLLRIYAPYLRQPAKRVINYIAVEPIPKGDTERGLSELEYSALDQTDGKRFWSANDLDSSAPRPPEQPASGWVERVDGAETLRVYILVEPFDNGAHVYLRLTFRADRPHEVGIATFAHADSVDLAHCIVTATMGNFARLRELHLADEVVTPQELWPDYRGDGFTPHAVFPLDRLQRTPQGGAVAVATPDEDRPRQAVYSPGTKRHWRYDGELARQRWRSATPDSELEVRVNARWVYWGSRSPIPGGLSYENFEMVAPFRQGEEFWFGVEPMLVDPGGTP